MRYRCLICQWVYDEEKEGKKFDELPSDWVCPMCHAEKEQFELIDEE